MSVIQVQAARGSTKPDAPSRDLYEEKNLNRVSKVPFYVGAALSALMLYFKNSVVPFAQAHEGQSEEQNQAARDHAQQQHAVNAIQDADLKKICLPGDFGTPDETKSHLPHLLKHGSLMLPMYTGIDMRLNDTRADSAEANFKPLQDFASSYFGNQKGVSAFPRNDNRLGAGGGGSGNSGSGGGGGGGGSGSGSGSGTTTSTKPPANTPKANNAPTVTGSVRLPDAFICDPISIMVAVLLQNVIDIDGDKLSVTNVKINGTSLTLVNDHYVYDGDAMGFTTVTYNVTDGTTSVADSAIVNFLPRLPILGTDGKDTLLGTDCGDNISAGAGDDTVRGQAGDDVIYGGSGDDTIYGDAGNDVIYGGDGNDTLYGGDGNDTIFGGNGDDTIYGGAGNNYLLGGAGNDLIYTGDGNSTVIGGSGRDWIFDGAGSDKIFGGIGNDTVFATMGGGASYYDGGAGVNKLNYATYTGSLDINLNNGTATSTGSGTNVPVDSFTNFQVIQGGTGGTVFHAKVIAAPPAAHVDVPSSSGDLHELSPQVSLPCPTNGDAETSETTVQVTTDSSSGDNLQHNHTPMVDLPAPEHCDVADVVTALPDAAVNQGYTYLGGTGTDVLDYSPAQQSLTIDVVHGMAHGAEIGTDYFSSIESFTSGAGDDTFIAAGQGTAHHMTMTDAPDELDLTAGPVLASNAPGNANLLVLDDASGDTITGAAVDQHFDGGAGFDTLNYSKAEHALDIDLTAATATGDDIGHDTFANIEHFVGGAGDDHFTVGSGTYVLEGGGGGDLFTFAAPNAGSETHAEIRGFEVGDLIQMSKYDIYEQPANAEDDQFQAIYADLEDENPGAATQDAVAPIRVRHETIHDLHKTYIETDLDDSGVYHTVAEIDGCHQLVINNHIV